MIEKYEDLNESYVTAGSGKNSTYAFYWGGYGTDQTGITNYDKVDGSNGSGYLKSESGSYNGTPNLSANVIAWTNGALSDWKGKANSNVLKGVTTGGGSYTSYATIGHVLNTFLAGVDAKGGEWGNKEDMDKEASFVNLVKDRDDDGRFAILWNFSSDDDITIKNTCHESFHVAMSVCQFCNMSLGFKVGEDEHAAYIAGFAGGCAYDFLYSNSTE